MRYNDRRFSIEGGAGLMGKYQLKSRKEGSVITLLEVDTECRAWYVKADDKDAAVKTLISMGESIRCLESIYVNGDDMTEDILSAFSAARKTSYPEEFMPESETDDFAPQGSYMPPEEMMPDDVPPPDEYGYEEAGAAPLSPLPSAEEIEAAASQSGREEASIADERPSEFAMPDILPDLASVLPKTAFVSSPKKNASGAVNGMYLGKKHITGNPVEIRTITDEADGVVFVGTVINCEMRELRSKKKLFLMSLADETNGISCKKFFDTFASAAEDALVHVAHNGGGHFPFAGRKFAAVERHFTDVEAQCQCLEFTVAAFGTGEAVVGMIGQDQFGYHFPGVHHAQGTGFHYHPFRATGSAGGSQIAASCHFDYTDAAGSGIVLDAGSFQVDVTQRRYVDADFAGGFEDGASFGYGDKVPVYLEGNLFFFHSSRF